MPKADKARVYAAALDEACRSARWDSNVAAPQLGDGLSWSELRRKFLKHNPNRALFSLVVELDRQVHVASFQAAQAAGFDADGAHEADFGLASFPRWGDSIRGRVARPPLIGSDHVGDIQQAQVHVEEAINNQVTPDDLLAARLVLAYTRWSVQSTHLEDIAIQVPSTISDVSSGYLDDLILRHFVLQGLREEEKNHTTAAIDSYSNACRYHSQLADGKRSLLNEASRWSEEAHYRRALLSASISPKSAATLDYHRSYTYLEHLPRKRAALLRSYLRILHSQSNPSLHEIATIQSSYEALLHRTTSFPKAGDSNLLLLDFVDRVFETWQQFVACPLVGNIDVAETQRVIRIHEKAQGLTFHSHRILRHLTHLHFAINNIGMALLTFDLYVRLWEKAKETDLVNVSKQICYFRAEAKNPSGASPSASAPSDAEAMDIDSTERFIETCCVGARLHCKFDHEKASATRALELMHRALELLGNKSDKHSEDKTKLRAKVLMWEGIARACCAYKDADPETRPENQKLALEALVESTTLDPSSFDALFHLAFVQAEQRKINAATTTIKLALELNPARKHAWHLLVLLVSADKKGKVGALKTVKIALGETESSPTSVTGTPEELDTPSEASLANDLPNSDIHPEKVAVVQKMAEDVSQAALTRRLSVNASDMRNDLSELGEIEGQQLPPNPHIRTFEEEGEEISADDDASAVSDNTASQFESLPGFDSLEEELLLRITCNILIEAVHGPTAALQDQKDLFGFFARHLARYILKTQQPPLNTAEPDVYGNRAPFSDTQSALRVPKSALSIRSNKSRRSALSLSLSPFKHHSGSVRKSTLSSTSPITLLPDATSSTGSFVLAESALAISDPFARLLHSRAVGLQLKLWLLSAATYRRSGDVESAHEALVEAERLDPSHPDIWVQLALLYVKQGDDKFALECLEKTLFLRTDYVPAVVHISTLLMKRGERFLGAAEGYLDVLTQTSGWDAPEAWVALADVYASTNRPARAKECLLYALQLEESRPIQALNLALPRVL